jgi:diguanylate cyclase (GGDEF)-like protein
MGNFVSIAIFISTLVILGLDLILPLGIAAGTPYGLVVFATLWSKRISHTYLVAVVGILFTTLGFYLSPDIISPMYAVIINRVLAVIIILASAILVIQIKKNNLHIKNLNILSLTDPLTGVENRLAYDRAIEKEIARDVRNKRKLSLAIIDIDNFKNVNDTHGHAIGDKVLKDTANIIRSAVRKTDLVFRLGGDEFAVLFIETGLRKTKKIGAKVCRSISQSSTLGTNTLTVSVGIAELEVNDNKDTLYNRTDKALYLSKNQGKNMVSTIPDM